MFMRKLIQKVGTIKSLKAQAISLDKGLKITYPNHENKTHEIDNAL